LQAFHAREVAPDNIKIFMIGDIDLKTAKESVEASFGSWKDKNDSMLGAVGRAMAPTPKVILVNQPQAVQSTIIAGHAIAPFNATSNTELTVLNAIFGGAFEARINMNLREDKGWSYGMYSGVQSNRSGDQTLTVSGSVQTDKTMESMQEIKQEFDEFLSTNPARDDELQRVKLNRTRSQPGRFATKRGFLQSMMASDSFGLPFDYAEGAAERLNAVSLQRMSARAAELMHPEELIWVIVGDLSEIEEKVRLLNYGEVEVWDGFGNKVR